LLEIQTNAKRLSAVYTPFGGLNRLAPLTMGLLTRCFRFSVWK